MSGTVTLHGASYMYNKQKSKLGCGWTPGTTVMINAVCPTIDDVYLLD